MLSLDLTKIQLTYSAIKTKLKNSGMLMCVIQMNIVRKDRYIFMKQYLENKYKLSINKEIDINSFRTRKTVGKVS